MKRNTIVLACCALLIANTMLAAPTKVIAGFIGRCAKGDGIACGKLSAAIPDLTDQALLAKIAIESNDHDDERPLQRSDVGKAAVEKLTDQAELAKIAVEDGVSDVRRWAVYKLADQALLAKIAVEDKDSDVRRAAAEKLTDQALLAKIAVEDRDSYVREALVWKVTDQALLAKIAVESKDSRVRENAAKKLTDQALLAEVIGRSMDPAVRDSAFGKLTDQALLAKIAVEGQPWRAASTALGKLTDQMLLAKIAVESKDSRVREAAVERLTDQAELAKIAENGGDRFVRTKAIAAMDGSNPALKRLAGDLGALAADSHESIARIKLAIQEPRIRNRIPRIVFAPSVSHAYQSYRGPFTPSGFSNGSMPGESVSFVLSQAGETLAKDQWSSDFPKSTKSLVFKAAHVHGEDLLAKLLQRAEFTQDDLAELCLSGIPEVRQAAVGNITDQALLAEIAVKAKNATVRQIAQQRLARIRKNTK